MLFVLRPYQISNLTFLCLSNFLYIYITISIYLSYIYHYFYRSLWVLHEFLFVLFLLDVYLRTFPVLLSYHFVSLFLYFVFFFLSICLFIYPSIFIWSELSSCLFKEINMKTVEYIHPRAHLDKPIDWVKHTHCNPCIPVSLYPCILASLYPCILVS